VKWSNIEQTCPRFDTATQDANPGSVRREPKALATVPFHHYKILSTTILQYTKINRTATEELPARNGRVMKKTTRDDGKL